MNLDYRQLVEDLVVIKQRLLEYERRYGVLTEDFYQALMSGELAEFDDGSDLAQDLITWAGIYRALTSRLEQRRQIGEIPVRDIIGAQSV